MRLEENQLSTGYEELYKGQRADGRGSAHTLSRDRSKSPRHYTTASGSDPSQRPVSTQLPAYKRDGFQLRTDNDCLFDSYRDHKEYLLDQSNRPVTGNQYESGGDYVLMMR